jgi:hypothetical protein
MQATFLKRILPFFLTLIVGLGVSLAVGRLFHSKSRPFRYRMVASSERGCKYARKYERQYQRAVSINSVPDAEIPPLFDTRTLEGDAFIKMEALFDSSGRVTEVRFPQFESYAAPSSERERTSRRMEQELMDAAAQQVRQIDFRPSRGSQWLNVETEFRKRGVGRGCDSVMVKISDQDGMRWEGETLAEGRRCGANHSSF